MAASKSKGSTIHRLWSLHSHLHICKQPLAGLGRPSTSAIRVCGALSFVTGLTSSRCGNGEDLK